MGMYWSTPRVLGVGYSTRLAPRHGHGCGGLLIGLIVLGAVIILTQVLLSAWYVTLPIALGLWWCHRAGTIRARNPSISPRRVMRLALRPYRDTPDTPQAAVSDRR